MFRWLLILLPALCSANDLIDHQILQELQNINSSIKSDKTINLKLNREKDKKFFSDLIEQPLPDIKVKPLIVKDAKSNHRINSSD